MTTLGTTNLQAPHQFIVVTSPPPAGHTDRLRGLGITQIVMAIIIIVTNALGAGITALIKDSDDLNMFLIGFGLWCPIFFLTSGSLGVAAAKQKTRKKLNALLGTSVTSCLLSVSVFSWAAVIVPVHVHYDVDAENGGLRIGTVVLGSLQLAAGLTEFITSVCLCKICGDHLCRTENKSSQRPQTVQYITTTNSDGTVSQQVVMSQFHQQMAVPPVGSISANLASSASMMVRAGSTMVVQPQGVIASGAETYPKMQLQGGYQQVGYHPYPVQSQPAYGAAQPYPAQPHTAYGAAHPNPASIPIGVHPTSFQLPPIETPNGIHPINVQADSPPEYDMTVGQMPNTEGTDNRNNTAL